MADRRRRAVAGINHDVVRKREQLIPDAGDERIEIATREICPANAALKQYVPVEDGLLTLDVEHDVPGRVAGREARLEAQRADFENLAVLERYVGIGGGAHGDAPPARAAALSEQRQVERVHGDRRLRRIDDVGERADVIEVRVGQQDQLDRSLEGIDGGENRGSIPTRINDND